MTLTTLKTNPSRRSWVRSALLVPCTLAMAMSSHAQAESPEAYPTKPIKLIVPFAPGGPNDVAARLVAPYLSQRLKQPVVIVNAAGGGGRIASKQVAMALADGYTLMVGGTNLNVVIPAAYKGLDYNPVDDFVPIGAIATDAMVLAIHPGLPVRTVQDFVRYSKSNPGKATAGSAPGIGPHFVIEMFKLRTGADLTFVPYRGAGPAIQDALGGHVAMTVTNKSVLQPLIQKGQLRGLAVTSDKRLADLPDVPTLRESGVMGVPSLNWYGLMAPARTPPAIVNKVRAALRDLDRVDGVRDGIRKIGLDPHLDEPDFGAQLAAQRRDWASIVKETGITLE